MCNEEYNIYRISLADVEKPGQIFDRARESGLFPRYAGKNLDAMYDVLTDIGEPVLIIFEGTGTAHEDVKEYIGSMKVMCKDAENDNPLIRVEWA